MRKSRRYRGFHAERAGRTATAIVTGGAKRIGAEISARSGGRRLACPHPCRNSSTKRRSPRSRDGQGRPGRSRRCRIGGAIMAALDGLRRRPARQQCVALRLRFGDEFDRRGLGRASRRQSAGAGPAVTGVRARVGRARADRQPARCQARGPQSGLLQLHRLQDRACRPYRACCAPSRRRSGCAGSRRR